MGRRPRKGKAMSMAKSFTVALGGSPAVLVQKAQAVAREAGASFQGDEASGRFRGSGVVGQYRIEGGQMTITITSKPFYAPWSLVESKVRSFFA